MEILKEMVNPNENANVDFFNIKANIASAGNFAFGKFYNSPRNNAKRSKHIFVC